MGHKLTPKVDKHLRPTYSMYLYSPPPPKKKTHEQKHTNKKHTHKKHIQKTEKQTISYHALAARSGVADSMETPLMAATGDAGHDRQQVGSQVACQNTVFFAILYFCMLFK